MIEDPFAFIENLKTYQSLKNLKIDQNPFYEQDNCLEIEKMILDLLELDTLNGLTVE